MMRFLRLSVFAVLTTLAVLGAVSMRAACCEDKPTGKERDYRLTELEKSDKPEDLRIAIALLKAELAKERVARVADRKDSLATQSRLISLIDGINQEEKLQAQVYQDNIDSLYALAGVSKDSYRWDDNLRKFVKR